MIVSESLEKDFLTSFTDGTHTALSDTTPEHGGHAGGFSPHDLLEAAMGNCIVIISRMYAKKHGIPLDGVTAKVTLKRDDPAKSVFEYSVDYRGDITDEQREKLLRAIQSCPVKKTLGREMVFTQV